MIFFLAGFEADYDMLDIRQETWLLSLSFVYPLYQGQTSRIAQEMLSMAITESTAERNQGQKINIDRLGLLTK